MEACDFFGNYHLDRLNNELCATRATLVLKKGVDCVEAIIRVANTLRGSLSFEKGKLSGPLMSTMMMGSEEQMKIETALTEGFQAGFSVHLVDYTLTLTTEQNTLVFERDVCVEMLVGEYMLSAFNGEHVSLDSLKLAFVPSGKGCISMIAQFTNSLRGELSLDDGILKGAVASTMNEVGGMMKEMEERFRAGMENGMYVSLDGKHLTLKDDHNVYLYLRLLVPDDLAGEYVLKSLNGGPVESDEQITLLLSHDAEADGIDVLAKVSNTLRGKATLLRDTLKGMLMSTRMMGSEAEMLVEGALTSGFNTGFLCCVDAGELTLTCGDNTLVYTKVAAVPYENGKPAYLGENVAQCFKGHGNGLMFRIINAAERKWAFYNDTKKYKMRVKVVFGTRSKVEGLGNTRITVSDGGHQIAEVTVAPGATEMFIVGYVNGYKCSYDALPV
ncbi:META domain containing protein [Trypanosoma theileri]|uniref:META domain containing protein n=1 Tax=Trypanosoma theileri TaxID=67003 RepID=A0A1X0NSU0_9TRYP|nr:META domain containing protein [Trypanosoma theileri]ORC87762.1 META domain containing protein [Trypanosoma theileri]